MDPIGVNTVDPPQGLTAGPKNTATGLPCQHCQQSKHGNQLPAGWRWVKVADLAETCSGTTPSRGRTEFYGGVIPWVKTGELEDNTITDTEEHITPAALQETSLRLLPKGTLLVAMYGQGQTRGRTGLLACQATTNQACFAILPNPSFDAAFLQLWFRHSYARLRQMTEGRGGNQPNLNGDVLRQEVVPLPPLPEQRRIARVLREQMEAVAAVHRAVEAQLEAARALSSAFLRATFTSPNVNKWQRQPLGKLCDLINGDAYRDTHWSREGTPIIRIQNLNDSSKPFNYWAGSLTDRVLVNTGDVLLAWSGTPGTSFGAHLWQRGLGVLNQHIFRVDLDLGMILPEWAVYAINEQLDEMIGKAHGGVGLRHVTRGEVEKLQILLPPLSEQRALSAKVAAENTAVEKLLCLLESKLASIEELPSALLREAFAGKI
jgi:restriction endonuclease S subunit